MNRLFSIYSRPRTMSRHFAPEPGSAGGGSRISTPWFRHLLGLLPVVVFTLLLLGLVTVRVAHGVVMPAWLGWLIGLLWGTLLLAYLIRFELLKQVGGLLIAVLILLIVTGALIPFEQAEQAPRITSEKLAQTFESTWNVVYQGNLFTDFSPKQVLIDFLHSIGDIDPFRTGKMVLFGILGFLLGVSYLFPMDPFQSRTGSLAGSGLSTRYIQRFLLVCTAGVVFAVHVELLQVLTRTRLVTALNLLENVTGILLGFAAFVPAQVLYAYLAERRKTESQRFNVLGVGVDAVTMEDCIARFEELIERAKPSRPAMTSALGVAGIIEARRTQKLQRILNESVLNTPDGMPLVWLGKLFGYRQIERVYGPDLLRDVCAYSAHRGWTHYFYGAAPGIVEKLKTVLEEKHPGIQIVGTYCPPFRPLTPEEEQELVAEVARVKPDIFWVGISTPKQLYFMDQMRDRLDCKIICPVGYAFDVNAGVELDAPEWIKYAGLQWFHRALKQPRLWRRYLPDNPRFMWASLLQFLHLKRYPLFVHECPRESFVDAEGYPRFPAGVVSLSAMSLADARDRILHWAQSGQKHYVNVCNADTMVKCFDQPPLAKIVNQSGMATTDGMPLVWLARRFGFKQATRVYGPDLMLELCCATASGDAPLRHYFYGATQDTLDRLQANLLRHCPGVQIAGAYAPPFRPLTETEKEAAAERINASGADIVWCGLGTPKQDYWVAEFRPRLNAAALVAVGAAFDFHARRIRQAPAWMMRSGLEWLFRLAVEPRRLWHRYLIGNPRFILLVLCRQLLPRRSANKEQHGGKGS